MDALQDRDYHVRAAAARALGDYRGKQVTDALQNVFTDPKPSVRLMAAASFIRASSPVPRSKRRVAGAELHQRPPPERASHRMVDRAGRMYTPDLR